MASRQITYKGERRTVESWAAKLGMQKSLIIQRLERGWTGAQALGLERRPRRGDLTYRGETLSTLEWSLRTGIAVSTIALRLKKGMTVGQALGFEPAD